MTPDANATLRRRVLDRVVDGPGDSNTSVRRGAFNRTNVPAELKALLDKIEHHAYKVTNEDLAQLQSKYSDDQLFEIIVAAALGASERRLLAGLKALDDA